MLFYFYVSTSQSRCAVPSMAVFCSSFMSCFLDKLLRYCLDDFEVDQVSLLLLVSFLLLHSTCAVSIIRSSNCRIFSASFLITFMSCEIAASVYIHVHFIITDYDVRLIVRVGTC
jgi:hypothetical protein